MRRLPAVKSVSNQISCLMQSYVTAHYTTAITGRAKRPRAQLIEKSHYLKV